MNFKVNVILRIKCKCSDHKIYIICNLSCKEWFKKVVKIRKPKPKWILKFNKVETAKQDIIRVLSKKAHQDKLQ